MRQHYSVSAILSAYGPEAFRLAGTPERSATLAADISEVAEETGGDFSEAAREHARRVGGARNLSAYLDCLQARPE